MSPEKRIPIDCRASPGLGVSRLSKRDNPRLRGSTVSEFSSSLILCGWALGQQALTCHGPEAYLPLCAFGVFSGIFVIGFSYPVVPKGKARIRVQISAVHSEEDIDRCVEAFVEVGRLHGALP